MEKAIVFVRYNVDGACPTIRHGDKDYCFSSGCWTPVSDKEDAIWFLRKAIKNAPWQISLDGEKLLADGAVQHVFDRFTGVSNTLKDHVVEEPKPKAKPKTSKPKSTNKKKTGPKKTTNKKKDGE